MFLEQLMRRNNPLISETIKHYQARQIPPNAYVLDLDMIEKNASIIHAQATKYNLIPFAMTKQIGRNPEVSRRIRRAGIEKIVAVDPWEAVTLAQEGSILGNVGHLVQIPEVMIEQIMDCQPEVITVFSYQKAKSINQVAKKQKRVQPLLLRVAATGDIMYKGQQGGIKESDWISVAAQIQNLEYVKIVGLTSFPCFLYQETTGKIEPTRNMTTLIRAKSLLEKELNLKLVHINAPSVNTSSSMKLLAEQGATHCEPGHSLTGTTPLHAFRDQPEKVSLLYVTEVSHFFNGRAYVFFGGHYRRSHVKQVAIYSAVGKFKKVVPVDKMAADSIDYYGSFQAQEGIEIGDICIYCFRTQIFTTRSSVVLLDGVSGGHSKIEGIYDSQGRRLE